MSRGLPAAAIAVAAVAILGPACGGQEGGSAASGDRPQLVVFGAASLQPAFEAYADEFPDAAIAYSFAGSDTLAAQIRQGLEPDVFAAANTAYPSQLFEDGLLREPVAFATNELVLAVPAGSEIDSLAAAAEPGTSLAIGAAGVPVGDYTREVLAELPGAEGDAILAGVASEEPDVSGIVAKLTQGAVDAGFVYRSDVAAAGDELRAIELPAGVSPDVAYGAGVGSAAAEPELARRFIEGLIDGPGAEALAAGDFGPPPGGTGGG